MSDGHNTRLCGMLGFAMRAGKLLIGTELICNGMAKRGASGIRLVVISSSASDNTKRKLMRKSEFYSIKAVLINMDTDELGALLGKSYAPAAVAVCDEGFAKEILKSVDENK